MEVYQTSAGNEWSAAWPPVGRRESAFSVQRINSAVRPLERGGGRPAGFLLKLALCARVLARTSVEISSVGLVWIIRGINTRSKCLYTRIYAPRCLLVANGSLFYKVSAGKAEVGGPKRGTSRAPRGRPGCRGVAHACARLAWVARGRRGEPQVHPHSPGIAPDKTFRKFFRKLAVSPKISCRKFPRKLADSADRALRQDAAKCSYSKSQYVIPLSPRNLEQG